MRRGSRPPGTLDGCAADGLVGEIEGVKNRTNAVRSRNKKNTEARVKMGCNVAERLAGLLRHGYNTTDAKHDREVIERTWTISSTGMYSRNTSIAGRKPACVRLFFSRSPDQTGATTTHVENWYNFTFRGRRRAWPRGTGSTPPQAAPCVCLSHAALAPARSPPH